MLNFNTFLPSSVFSINEESNFLTISEKLKLQVHMEYPINFFHNYVPLKSSDTVDSANLFQRILNSLCVFREYDKSVHRSRKHVDRHRTESILVNFRPKPK
jgi:hypothetical protein